MWQLKLPTIYPTLAALWSSFIPSFYLFLPSPLLSAHSPLVPLGLPALYTHASHPGCRSQQRRIPTLRRMIKFARLLLNKKR
jgi:hypothetical protein